MEELRSVSRWIEKVKANDQEAAQRLYERYLQQLANQARKRMNESTRRMADEEDIAHTALTNFFAQIRQGSFPQLANRYDLWQVLLMLTNRRIADLERRRFSLKRGAGREVGESSIGTDCTGDCRGRAIEQVVGREPEPDVAVELEDLCQQLLDQLDDPLLKQIATLKLEGHDHSEIAHRLGCVRRTVQRKLLLIREIWQAQGGELEPVLSGQEPASLDHSHLNRFVSRPAG